MSDLDFALAALGCSMWALRQQLLLLRDLDGTRAAAALADTPPAALHPALGNATGGCLQHLSSVCVRLWAAFASDVRQCGGTLLDRRRATWLSNIDSRLGDMCASTFVNVAEAALPCEDRRGVKERVGLVNKLRRSPLLRPAPQLLAEDLLFPLHHNTAPVMFMQRLVGRCATSPLPPVVAARHFFVLVHGFQGNKYDLRLLKNQISDTVPLCEFVQSSCNEGDTYGDLQTLGRKLAKEVSSGLASSPYTVGRLSFVCHSIGGLIVRAALDTGVLSAYMNRLCAYVSLGTPHLGYTYSENSLFDSGMWLLKKLKNSSCLHQLTMSDTKSRESSFLFRLSKAPHLSQFRVVVLAASPQDGYTPFFSSRIEAPEAALRDSRSGSVHVAMVCNVMKPLLARGCDVVRLEVHFHLTGRGLDSTIRRAAHIMFLESVQFSAALASLLRTKLGAA